MLNRRQFHTQVMSGLAVGALSQNLFAQEKSEPFKLNYIVASAMYGKLPLAEILPEVRKCGAEFIEIWAERHGNQREQIDEMGEQAFLDLLAKHKIKLGSITCFKFGIFNMQGEMDLAHRLGGDMVICNTPKPTEEDLTKAVKAFAEKIKPHVEHAEQQGVTLGVENHGGGVINTPESIRQLMEEIPSKHLGLAMAPYHLPQEEKVIADLIRDLGDRLVHFQAWEHGDGCIKKLPKEQEMLQLPHRGPLDWQPLIQALSDINYSGRTEIFMHPVPRGIPILPTKEEVTAEINSARKYLDEIVRKVNA